MSTFQAFQTGLQAGKAQRREREAVAARSSAADLFKAGNYEGAESILMRTGLMDEASAYAAAGQRRKAAEDKELYAKSFSKDGYSGVAQTAGARGDFQTAGAMEAAAFAGDQRERQTQQWEQQDYMDGLKFLGDQAQGLKSLPIEARGAEALRIIENSPFNSPEVRSSIEAAMADGKLTDDELDGFTRSIMDGATQIQMEIDANNRQQDLDYRDERDAVKDAQWEKSYDLDARRAATAETAAQAELAKAMTEAQTAPALQGLPTAVQSRIVGQELDVLNQSDSRLSALREIATLTDQFNEIAENYGAQGEGLINDFGQIFSMKTSDLKQISNKLVPAMREAGSGPMSDKDAEMYRSSIVNVNNTRKTNLRVAKSYAASVENEEAYNEFLRWGQAQYGYGSQQQLIQTWNQYADENPLYNGEGDVNIGEDGRLTRPSIQEWMQAKAAEARVAEIDAELEALMAEGVE